MEATHAGRKQETSNGQTIVDCITLGVTCVAGLVTAFQYLSDVRTSVLLRHLQSAYVLIVLNMNESSHNDSKRLIVREYH